MDAFEIFSRSQTFYSSLEDELSKYIYSIRLSYLLNRNYIDFLNGILKITDNWNLPEVDCVFTREKNIENIIIFGAGEYGKYTYKLLMNSKYKKHNILFTDNNSSLWNSLVEVKDNINGVCGKTQCISTNDLKKYHDNSVVIIGSGYGRLDIINQLAFIGFPFSRVVIPVGNHLLGTCGWQYFDMFSSNEDEIFLDAGCFDGFTSGEFIRWTNNKFKHIYAFEADPIKTSNCKEYLNKYCNKVTFFDFGCWDKKETLKFESDYHAGTRILESGNISVQVDSIDNALKGKPVSFIKMDIEGAEYNALRGAKNTIRNYKPRLAISLYHKPEDLYEIPFCLSELNPSYKYAIRHYFSDWRETVLYAF